MEAKNETPPPIIDQLKDYAETRIKLAKYQAIEGGTSIAAGLIADVAVFISSVLAFIFASFTLALYLGKLLRGDYWMGFGIVAMLFNNSIHYVKANEKRRIRKAACRMQFVERIFSKLKQMDYPIKTVDDLRGLRYTGLHGSGTRTKTWL